MRVSRLQYEGEELLIASYPLRRPGIFAELTQAEVEVVELVLDGLDHRTIAQRRGVAPRTIANQLSSAYRKLGVSGSPQLASLVHRTRDDEP